MTVSKKLESLIDTIDDNELRAAIMACVEDMREEIKELDGELLEAQFPKYSKHRRSKWDDEWLDIVQSGVQSDVPAELSRSHKGPDLCTYYLESGHGAEL